MNKIIKKLIKIKGSRKAFSFCDHFRSTYSASALTMGSKPGVYRDDRSIRGNRD